MTQDAILINKKEIRTLIEEIEDRLDELIILTEPKFIEEVKKKSRRCGKRNEGT